MGSKAEMTDLVVMLPGITGSVLQRGGRDVWNLSARAGWSVAASLGGSIRSLRLEGDDPDADDAPDGVRASALIEDLVLVPGLYKLDGYTMLPRKLAEEFVLRPCGPDDDAAGNFLKFPYDWRRDVRASALGGSGGSSAASSTSGARTRATTRPGPSWWCIVWAGSSRITTSKPSRAGPTAAP